MPWLKQNDKNLLCTFYNNKKLCLTGLYAKPPSGSSSSSFFSETYRLSQNICEYRQWFADPSPIYFWFHHIAYTSRLCVHMLDRNIAKCDLWDLVYLRRLNLLGLPQRLLTEFCAMFRDRRWFMATKCWDNFALCRDAFAKHSDCSHTSLIILANHESGGGGGGVEWDDNISPWCSWFSLSTKSNKKLRHYAAVWN